MLPSRPNPNQSAATRPAPLHPPAGAPRVLVVAFQGGKQADGGIESLTLILERLAGPSLLVVTQLESPKARRWRDAGCEVQVWPLPYLPGGGRDGKRAGALRQLAAHVGWNLRIAWLVFARRIDVAHINDPHALWHTAAALRLLGVPVIFNLRDTKPSLGPRERMKWRLAFALSRAQIALSREMVAFWRGGLGLRAASAGYIYSVADFGRLRPLDPAERAARRRELGLGERFTVGYVASFSEKKAQLRFIEQAGPALQAQAPGLQIVFLGDFEPDLDPYARACAEAVRRLGLEDVFGFRGYEAAMERWYPALDATVVATRNEGLARCMLESLACGTPVVSFAVCSAREILEPDGGCGRVVAQGDYAGLVAALRAYAADPAERARAGRTGAAVARRIFQGDRNVAAYAGTYAALGRAGVPVC